MAEDKIKKQKEDEQLKDEQLDYVSGGKPKRIPWS